MPRRKPFDKFPLWLPATGQRCKKRCGQFYYFGIDKAAALKRFTNEWGDIVAGRAIKPDSEETSVADVANHFLTAKRNQTHAGELSARMWSEYHGTCELIVAAMGRDRKLDRLGQARGRTRRVGRSTSAMANPAIRPRCVLACAGEQARRQTRAPTAETC